MIEAIEDSVTSDFIGMGDSDIFDDSDDSDGIHKTSWNVLYCPKMTLLYHKYVIDKTKIKNINVFKCLKMP